MLVSPHTQAVLLLTAHFSKAQKGAVKPLTPKEWGRFALWLKERSLTPEQLMNERPGKLLNGWSDKTITPERIESLINRGSALAVAMEKWLRAGLWILTRSDPDYPVRLKNHLRMDSPALLFGCGNKALLNGGGLAVIGSRNATGKDLVYSRSLGELASNSGYTLVSGGARGVDEASMLGALEAEGTVIGVLANDLLRACTSAKYRQYLMANNLVLVSPFYPEAGFNTGNSMQRNKYIYCLADAAVVVHSGKSGGTWSGALENLKKQWIPLYVKRTQDSTSGAEAIIDAGAQWLPEDISGVDLKALFSVRRLKFQPEGDVFNPVLEPGSNKSEIETRAETVHLPVSEQVENVSKIVEQEDVSPSHLENVDFYDVFLFKMQALCSSGSVKTVDDLVDELQLQKTQLNVWLKRAVAEGKLDKLSRPVRYQWISIQQNSLPL